MNLPLIHERFDAFVEQQPSAPAVISDSGIQTYSELNSAVSRIVCELHNRGVAAGDTIGVLVERSAHLPQAFLGILKAGCVYVPMVADLPDDRLAAIAAIASIRQLIVLDGITPPQALISAVANNGTANRNDVIIRPELLSATEHCPGSFPLHKPDSKSLAAILFTSGSTGVPKGVMIQHDACVNMGKGHIEAHDITPDDRILLSTSPGFILGFRELCLPPMSGAAYVPVSRATINQPDNLLALMGRHSVSFASFTPSYLRLLHGVVPQGLRCIITAGERPNADDARNYANHVEYWNVHGATEVCGTICMHRVDPHGSGPLPSGRPFANTSVYLLDENGAEVAPGEIGEIHVVGAGLSPGYLKQPELTSRYFIETRFGRAYRTHDLGRWDQNGNLETIGRADDVVKISGQSVSLAEIENALARHGDVTRVAAFQYNGRLVGCVECSDPEQARKVDWRGFLGRTLPGYMIPAQIAPLAVMPISSAGKVDRNALLAIASSLFDLAICADAFTAPQGALEEAIAGVWESFLEFRPIMREHNFFTVGGSSLLAIAISQRLQHLGHKVTVQNILSSLTVEVLAARIVADEQILSDEPVFTPIENLATGDQEDFWISAEIGVAPASSHIVRTLGIQGANPGLPLWQTAWQRLLERHAALRTAFIQGEDGGLYWNTLEIHQLAAGAQLLSDQCDTLQSARELIAEWAGRPFQLTLPPLVRAGLITVEEDGETLLWLVMHHSVVDGMSAGLIQEELLQLVGGQVLPPVPHGIALASHAQQRYLVSGRAAVDRAFWHGRLNGLVERGEGAFNEYVAERPRPAMASGEGAAPLSVHIDAATVEALGRLAKAQGAGLHALLLSILGMEIRRRTGYSDIIIGSGISTRPAGAEAAVGHFVNLLPVVLEQNPKPSFKALLNDSQTALTETVEHASYPAGLLYREFRQQHPGQRARSRTALFDIALTAIPPRTTVGQESALTLTPRLIAGAVEYPPSGLDFSFSHEPCPESGGLNLLLVWNRDVCSEATAAAWLASLAAWAVWLAENPGRVDQPPPALLPHEAALLQQWESGATLPRPACRSHEIFEGMVDRYPRQPAVVSPEQPETLATLDARANGIAQALLKLGAIRGTTIAVLTGNSSDLPAVVLGIWKAGGVYLPLSDELPPARLLAMFKDAAAEIVVALDGIPLPDSLAGMIETVIRPEACPPSQQRHHCEGSRSDIAYIIYTSGTTGLPKGIPVTHAAYVNAILGASELISVQSEDRVSLASTVGFDASLWELGLGLLNGIAMVPVSKALRDDPWRLKRYYSEHGVTIAFHTPSYLRVSEQLPFEGLRVLLTGGEAPNHHDVSCYAAASEFWNFYGPTESTIIISGERIMPDLARETPLTVGCPLPNTLMSLRRADGTPVPPGVTAEIWLGGAGLTPGYLNRPELTAASFVTLPEGRFYRSGDYGRWTADGRIAIAGRMDDQIKLNGQRIELGEIEGVLRLHPSVLDAVVLIDAVGDGAKVLRAFVRCAAEVVTEAALTGFLADRLPVHMLPASITAVPDLPLTPAGKVDREALLVCFRAGASEQLKEAPRDPLEALVAGIWGEILHLPVVSREDNFFGLGGNSLLAVTMAHRVSERLGRHVAPRSLFVAPTLASFVQSVVAAPAVEETAAADSGSDLASEGELEFWVAQAAGLDAGTFTIPVHRLVTDPLDRQRLSRAWSHLAARHEGLRTFFEEDDSGQLYRRVVSSVETVVESVGMPDHAAALAHIRQRQSEALPMGVAPLWRIGLVNVEGNREQLFWLALHHSVGDGQSVGILLAELSTLLGGGILQPLDGTPRAMAGRNLAYLAGMGAIEDQRYWGNLLGSVPEHAFDELPLDRERQSLAQPGMHRMEVILDRDSSSALAAMARHYAASIHSIMLTLLALEAGRRSGRPDIMIGTTASVRESASDQQMVGYAVNMLPLRITLPPGESFGTLLQATQQRLGSHLQHARYPFSRIYREFWKERPDLRHPRRYPLFDLAVTEHPDLLGGDLQQRFIRLGSATDELAYEYVAISPGQDIVLMHEGLADGNLMLLCHVNAAIYSEESARSWFENLINWVGWLTGEPDRAEQPLPRLLPHEEERLALWEHGETVSRPEICFHELFETVADRPGQGDRPAVITESAVVSYAGLEYQANLIANALLLRGVSRGSVVGVLSGRSPHLPAAALAVWKAGATYLPLAADLPGERLAFMAADAGASQLIVLDGAPVTGRLLARFPDPLRPEAFSPEFRRIHAGRPACGIAPGDVAYILYTSGSTGQPKGTLISHGSYLNLLLGAGEMIGFTSDDRSLMFASPSFDVSLSDFGVPLAHGAAVCPVPVEVIQSPVRFLDFLSRLRISVADITPTYLRLLDGAPLPATLHTLVTGGEAPLAVDVAIYSSQLRYFNAYGPTENSITSSMGLLLSLCAGCIPCGRPLPNTTLHVCDPHGQPVMPGVAGEIWLGGSGLALGYLNRPELTEDCFVDTGLGRRYRSGDLGRWRSDGTIEVLGRIDDQVKLNGIRIELGEIEHALVSHPQIQQAVVLLAGHVAAAKSLWAFVRPVAGEKLPLEEQLQAYLRERLPSHMIPSGVISLAEIPLTTAGKVDRAALLLLLAERPAAAGLSLPADELERSVAEVWSDVLGHGPIHREDNFFALGGQSLLAIAVAHRLERDLNCPVPAREIFAEPTLAGFSARLRGMLSTESSAVTVSDAASEGQREFWTAEQTGQYSSGFNIPLILTVDGEIPAIEQWRAAWHGLLMRHDALRTGFREDGSAVLRRFVASPAAVFEQHDAASFEEAIRYIKERQGQPFTMAIPGLWRCGLVHLADGGRAIFWLVLHHSIADGLSLGILVDELAALLNGRTLVPLTARFDQSAGSEELYLNSDAARNDAAYWQQNLNTLIERAPTALDEWPLDRQRPLTRGKSLSKQGHCHRSRLDAVAADGLRRLARKNGVSLHALLLTMLGIEVRRRTGRSEFLLGTAASTRQSAAEAQIVGYYINMLPLPCRVSATDPFRTVLTAMQQALAEALQHAHYPFARIYENFRQAHPQVTNPGRYPLFDIAVTENPGSATTGKGSFWFDAVGLPENGAVVYEMRTSIPAQDMVLIHEGQSDGSLVLTWFVNAALYTEDTARGWFDALLAWIRFFADDDFDDGGLLPALLAEEQRLLDSWQYGEALPHSFRSFPDLFRHLAEAMPQNPAVVTDSAILTYADVNRRTDGLAQRLLQHGVRSGEPVAVFTERSAALPETVLAIWKSGGCYLPLTADLPAERLDYIAADAGIRILIVLDALPLPEQLAARGYIIIRPGEDEGLNSAAPLASAAGLGVEIAADDPAYIIYTSGSTGVPKGVLLCHGGLLNLGLGLVDRFDFRGDDRALLAASPSFDAWISDLMMSWSVGGAVVPVQREQMNDISGMRDFMSRLCVTAATLPPSYLRLFEKTLIPELRILMTVGEPPIEDDARFYAAHLSYFNGYGPTENTAATSIGRILDGAEIMAAGRPLANTSIHILDHERCPVPPGVAGQIWVAGRGLAIGYLNQPELTAASFVMINNQRYYCTGDMGRWLRSGELQVLGRTDSQVKLRGQRVELSEIENRLARIPAVRQAVAAVETVDDGTQILRAFVTLSTECEEPAPAVWLSHLAESLPAYMIPSSLEVVADIPLSVAGKVDRQTLIKRTVYSGISGAGASRGTAPQGDTEEAVARVWAELFSADSVCREDNFFELGGDSLRAIAVISKLRLQFDCQVNDLYEHPVMAEFAKCCRQRPEHLRELIGSVCNAWKDGSDVHVASEAERDDALRSRRAEYSARFAPENSLDLTLRRSYRHILLTGATGYLGCYLLRELLLKKEQQVTVIVRGGDDLTARHRLGRVLAYYFGDSVAAALRDNPFLTVLAGDLRHAGFQLAPRDLGVLMESLDAVCHCAANVNHYGHYSDFQADNVAATSNLLALAGHKKAEPADFHYISTLSVAGKTALDEFRLFTEYDTSPDGLDDNYYIRSKQQGERLVMASRGELANACIHRVGNVVFAADGTSLQRNIQDNAFFRQLSAFIKLGIVPQELHASLCYVDVAARAIVALADRKALANSTFHIEKGRLDRLSDFVQTAAGMAERVRLVDFGGFLERLQAAIDEPGMERGVAESVETFGIRDGRSMLARIHRLAIASDRTNALLERIGVCWPSIPPQGQNAMIGAVLDALAGQRRGR